MVRAGGPRVNAIERSVETPLSGAARPEGRWRAAGRRTLAEILAVLGPYLASRFALLTVGLLTNIVFLQYMARTNPLQLAKRAAFGMWGAWDSGYYVTIATSGYAAAPGADGYANWAFFPAYPLLGAALARLLHAPVFFALLAISNLSFIAALVMVRRLARTEFDERTAGLAVLLLCVVPGSYVFSSAYTESLFLLATCASLLLMRAERWLAAGALAALAVLTRNLGVGLLLPMAILGLAQLRRLYGEGGGGDGRRRRMLAAAGRLLAGGTLPLLALAAFCFYLYRISGDPLAFLSAQKGWGRAFGDPLSRPLLDLLHPQARLDTNDLVSFAFVWLSLALLGGLAFTRKWWLVAFAAFLVLGPLSGGVPSYARYCLVTTPLYIFAASLLARRPLGYASAAVTVLAMLNGFMMTAWTFGLGVTA